MRILKTNAAISGTDTLETDREMENRPRIRDKVPRKVGEVQKRIVTFGQMCGSRGIRNRKTTNVHTVGMETRATTETGMVHVKIDH